MAYAPFYAGGWADGESGETPITAEALDHIEAGIATIDADYLPRTEAATVYLTKAEAESLETDALAIALAAQVYS